MSGGSGGSHSLSFRVMRLCKPSFHVDTSLRFHPLDILTGEDSLDDPALAHLPPLLHSHSSNSDPSYRNRFVFSRPFDPSGLSGLLVLPQSFGSIYLGETFSSYISINNSSNFEVIDVIVKAEIQTERQRVLLLDASKSPIGSIRAGGRYDFIVEHDIKELGAHTLVCTALYNDGEGERKYLPQFFKFAVSNPLSVKTKVRVVKDTTFMEACIENHTKVTLYMDQVEFEPSQHWSVVEMKSDMHDYEKDATTRKIFKKPILLTSGGVRNFLYQLRLASHVSTQMENVGNNILGKLQITWHMNLGESGRLQTQHILTNQAVSVKELDLKVVDIPSPIVMGMPFLVRLNLRNETEKKMGPFQVLLQSDQHEDDAILIHGLHTLDTEEVQGLESTDICLNLIAVKLGIHRIPGVTLVDIRAGKSCDFFPDSEVFVDSACDDYTF